MSKINLIEPVVEEALIQNPATRGDNFILYIEVLKKFVNVELPLDYVFANHKSLGVPALETITRCRRKLQELNPNLRDEKAKRIRHKEEESYKDYASEI